MTMRKQGLSELNTDATTEEGKPDLEKVISRSRDAFNLGRTRTYEFRKLQLEKLLQLCEEEGQELAEALSKDLNKDKFEAYVGEIYITIAEIKKTLTCLKDWMKPEQPQKPPLNLLDKVFIKNDPRGVVLIIGAWNYPIQLTIMPLIGAIAAGNCVILKPSEVASASSKTLAVLIPKYLDQDCFHVVEGGVPETTELLKHKFDYIFYTGSPHVGKIIGAAANKYLTPTTLELGGKSPVYIDDTADMNIAARRILWGKFINAGQTCIAPDYMLCTKEVQDKFITEAKNIIKSWYGQYPAMSPDFCRIINDRNFKRLCSLMKSGETVIGGETDENSKYISPTVMINVKLSDPVMQEEIFGPLLPIINVSSPLEAVEIIRNRDSPLTMYLFSTDKKTQSLFLDSTTSGSVCVNDTLTQFLVDTLPFGGVGNSGIGAYHGKYTFDTFTHKKSCLAKDFNSIAENLLSYRYPPYNEKKMSMMKYFLNYRKPITFKWLPHVLLFILGLIGGFAINIILRIGK